VIDRKRWMACLTGVAACSLIVTAAAQSQQSKDKPATGQAPGAPALSEDMSKAMAAMEAYAALNEFHGYMKQWEGDWEIKSTWWMSPGAPPTENKLTSSAKLINGGRQIVEKVKGELTMGDGTPPQPFEGTAIVGYDNFKKKYYSHWIDNMMSGCMTEWGTAASGGKVFTFEGENYCPMNGKICKTKSVATVVDANTRKFEMWGPDLAGNTYKVAEMIYTRKK